MDNIEKNRETTNNLQLLLDDGVVSHEEVLDGLLFFLSEYEVKQFFDYQYKDLYDSYISNEGD